MAKAHAPAPTPAQQRDEPASDAYELDKEDLAALRAALQRGEDQYQRGAHMPAEVLLQDLREILGEE